MLEEILVALYAVLHWQPVIAMLVGILLGILFGAMPGLTATMAVAMMIPLTFILDPLTALGLIAGVHNGASYGGAIPAVLLNIPGSPGAIVTTFDGYPMNKKGQAGPALKLSAVSSAVGGVLGAVALVTLAPPLSTITLAFGPPEIFWVNIFGLASISVLLGDDFLKGMVAACVGLLIGVVGIDNVTGYERMTFNVLNFTAGIPLLIVMVGIYSLPPAWNMARMAITKGLTTEELSFSSSTEKVWTWLGMAKTWVRSSVIGIVIGILPGAGGVGGFIAYSEAKRASKDPGSFGKGNPEGLAAAESVNNADNAAAMIPALTLGVPGSGIAALILGALSIHGMQPGPQLFREDPTIVYGYTLMMLLTAVALLFVGGAMATRIFGQILRLPQVMLMPLIVCLTVVGSFTFRNTMFDVYLMLAFGLLGLAMIRYNFPVAPLILGLVLGGQAEFNLRISLLISQNDLSIFWTRPISQIVILLTGLVLIYPSLQSIMAKRRNTG